MSGETWWAVASCLFWALVVAVWVDHRFIHPESPEERQRRRRAERRGRARFRTAVRHERYRQRVRRRAGRFQWP